MKRKRWYYDKGKSMQVMTPANDVGQSTLPDTSGSPKNPVVSPVIDQANRFGNTSQALNDALARNALKKTDTGNGTGDTGNTGNGTGDTGTGTTDTTTQPDNTMLYIAVAVVVLFLVNEI